MPSDVILVDSSVWIAYLTNKPASIAQTVEDYLPTGVLATSDPIVTEVTSGARSKSEFDKLKTFFTPIGSLTPPTNIWEEIARHRFELQRQGYQCKLIVLWIAVVAKEYQIPLWTLDKDFEIISQNVPLELWECA